MTNRNSDANEAGLTKAIDFAFVQNMKQIHTSMPGLIVSYDAATQRAKVQPAPKSVLPNASYDKPIIADVPIIFPSGGGYILHFPLVAGDPVHLHFSERGISMFKENFSTYIPDFDGFFSMRDAVGQVGYGQADTVRDGVSLQSNDGSTFLRLEGGQVYGAATRFNLTGDLHVTGNINASGDVNVQGDVDAEGDVEAGAISLKQHRHGGVQSGGSTTLVPQ